MESGDSINNRDSRRDTDSDILSNKWRNAWKQASGSVVRELWVERDNLLFSQRGAFLQLGLNIHFKLFQLLLGDLGTRLASDSCTARSEKPVPKSGT